MYRALILALVVAACGGAASQQSDTTLDQAPAPPVTESVGSVTEDDATASTPPSDASPTTVSDRPLAPEFTLALGDGGSYTLSEGEKPVYMVFWAEW